jgi:hypothetical protein
MTQRRERFYVFGILALLGLLLYGYGLGISRYYDDFSMFFEEPQKQLYSLFYETSPTNPFYRPITTSLFCLVQLIGNNNVVPIHIVNIVLHALLGLLIVTAALRMGLSRPIAWGAAFFFTITQANGIALLSNDTFAQILVALFGYASLYFGYFHLYGTTDKNRNVFKSPYVYTTAGLYALGLLSKEAGISFLLCHVMLVIVAVISGGRQTLRAGGITLGILGVITAGFLLVYMNVAAIQPRLGSDHYSFQIGPGIVTNTFMMLLSALYVGSTASLVELAGRHEWVRAAGAFVPTLLFAATLIYGYCITPKRRLVLLLAGITFLAMIPVVALRHISELYVYNCMPAISILVGLVTAQAADRFIRSNRQRGVPVIAILVITFTGLNIGAIVDKTARMYRVVTHCETIAKRVVDCAGGLRTGDTLRLVSGDNCRVPYSVFSLSAITTLEDVAIRLQWKVPKGVIFSVVDSAAADRMISGPRCLVLGVEDCDASVRVR